MSRVKPVAAWLVALSALLSGACAKPAEVETPEQILSRFTNHLEHSLACPLALVAQLKGSGNALAIAFTMTNIGQVPFVVPDWELPWGNVHSLEFVVIKSNGSIVSYNSAIDDPYGDHQTTLAAGASIQGDYRLCGTSICYEARKDELTVLWLYRFSIKAGEPSSCTGVVVIPKQN
jgi:hypothetical protein